MWCLFKDIQLPGVLAFLATFHTIGAVYKGLIPDVRGFQKIPEGCHLLVRGLFLLVETCGMHQLRHLSMPKIMKCGCRGIKQTREGCALLKLDCNFWSPARHGWITIFVWITNRNRYPCCTTTSTQIADQGLIAVGEMVLHPGICQSKTRTPFRSIPPFAFVFRNITRFCDTA